MKRALFICTHNRLRSPTAEQVFSTIIFVMEKKHRNQLGARFRRDLNGKRVICLDIPDDYTYMQPELVKLLESKAGPFLGK